MVENVHDTPNKVLYLSSCKLLPWILLTGSSDLWIQIGGGLYIRGSQYWVPLKLQDILAIQCPLQCKTIHIILIMSNGPLVYPSISFREVVQRFEFGL